MGKTTLNESKNPSILSSGCIFLIYHTAIFIDRFILLYNLGPAYILPDTSFYIRLCLKNACAGLDAPIYGRQGAILGA